MVFPRRFYVLFVVSIFAILGTYFFLDLRRSSESVLTAFSEEDAQPHVASTITKVGKEEHDTNGLRPVPEVKTEEKETNNSVDSNVQPVQPPKKEVEEVSIAIMESGGSHDEVTAALVHAFGRYPNSKVSLYLLLQRYGISQILSSFNLSNPIAGNHSSFELQDSLSTTTDAPPKILVSSTCELDLVRLDEPYTNLLKGEKTFLFCVVHHPDMWAQGELVDKVKPWVDRQMIHFLALSAHTAHYFRTKAVANWPYNATVLVNHIPPVFPVVLPEVKADLPEEPLSFALQGDYDPTRQNYTSTFERLETVVKNSRTRVGPNAPASIPRDVELHLIGHGTPPEVPKAITDQVVFDNSLDYMDHYAVLSRTFSVLPSFASAEYLDREASSSVPASLIAGAALIVSLEILEAYSYVPLDAVWLQEVGESEMDTVERVLQWPFTEHERKRKIVRASCKRLVQRNTELVEDWVKNGLAKVRRAEWTHKAPDV